MRSESINGLSAEVIIKDEPYEDIGYLEHQILKKVDIKQEGIESKERFLSNITFEKVLEDLRRESNALAKVLEEDVIEPCIKVETKVSIKQEEELEHNLYGLEDILNKHLKITLTRLKCFMCDHCPEYYKEKKDLLHHIHTEHYALFRNCVNITQSLHYCSICNKRLTYKLWHSHMNIVHSNRQWKCKNCYKVFKHKRYLQRHQMYVHENLKPSWRFRNITSTVNSHISIVSCVLCSKQFNSKQSLHTHRKNCHSGNKATCKICNSILKCQSYLNTHMRRVHYDDGKLHCCDLCQKQFKSPRYLKIHIKNAHKYK